MKKFFNEGNQIHNFIPSSGSGTVINSCSGSDFLTCYGSGSTSRKVTVPVPVLQRCLPDPNIGKDVHSVRDPCPGKPYEKLQKRRMKKQCLWMYLCSSKGLLYSVGNLDTRK